MIIIIDFTLVGLWWVAVTHEVVLILIFENIAPMHLVFRVLARREERGADWVHVAD